jgi:putative transposase
LLDFNGESDYVHLIIDYKPDIALSKLIANLKTVSSRLIRKEFPYLAAKYFYNKPYFWTGAYFVASCGGVTVEQLKKYVENQNSPKVETLPPHFSQRKRMECLKALPSIDLNPILAQLPQRQCVVRI